MRSLVGLVLSMLVLMPGRVFAAKSLDFTIHQEYTSTRALGMGNAFTAVADDHSALFYNPAALARREDGQVRMFLRAGIDDKYIPLFKAIDKASKLPTEAEQVDAMTQLIENSYGEHYYLRAPTLGAVWVRPNWGVAFIPVDLSVDVAVHQQIGPMLNVNAYADSTLAYGYAKEFHWFGKDNFFSTGATVKAIHRVNVGSAVSAGELASDSKVFSTRDINEGMTFDVDVGTLFIPQVGAKAFLKPTFAIVGRNLLDYGFKSNLHLIDKNSGEPPKLQRRFDFGSKFDLPKFWVFDPHLSVDIRDVMHTNWTWKKGSHVGAELYWKMYNWWKGHWAVGMNQGYWTAGFGARMAVFQLDMCSFGEEVGTSDVPKQSRRYMLEMSLDF